MRMSDKLKEVRANLLDRLEKLSETAAEEGRELNTSESAAWDAAMKEARDLEQRIERQLAAEALQRGGQGAPMLLNERGEPLTVLRSTDKLAERHRGGSAELAAQFSVGHAVRGIATGRWEGRDALQRAMNEGTGPGGTVRVPTPLSAQWLDLARSQAVLGTAGPITVPMESQTLRIAGLETDVVPAFRAELTDFPTSNNTFRALDLRARTIGIISEMSIELMADSPNA
jgi:HK97 family phage major capsid protein